MLREQIAGLIAERLARELRPSLKTWQASKSAIGFFFVDDLLPADMAAAFYHRFPDPGAMKLRQSLRESKYVGAQMNAYDAALEELIYAFQDQRVVDLISSICSIEQVSPDQNLYAGGLSMMGKNQFLNPHLDNSHDHDRSKWRVLNLLYYVSPDWKQEYGGNLEIWPRGLSQEPIVIHSKFNRLAVIATHSKSWHSVSPVSHDGVRCCVSNYYFSNSSLRMDDTFHVTSFRGRPEQTLRDQVLRADAALRNVLRKFRPKGLVKTDHIYKK